jgi:hypothetical protein
MIVMTFTIELDTGLSHLLQSALPLANDRSRDHTHRRGQSKRSYGHCRRRTEIPEAEGLAGSRLHASGPARVRVVLVRRCGRPRALTARCRSLAPSTFPGVENVALAPS